MSKKAKETPLTTETVSATYWKDRAISAISMLETAMEKKKDLAELLQVKKFKKSSKINFFI